MYYLTIDIGTTAIKVAIYNDLGVVVSESSRSYTLETPSDSIVELSPYTYWNCIKSCINEVVASLGSKKKQVVSIAISSQAETLIMLDKEDHWLMPAIVWLDNRSFAEAEEIQQALGTGPTGLTSMQATWPATKILWLRKHRPAIFKQVHTYMLLEDYIILLLTGEYIGEYSLYSTSALLNVRDKQWWQEMLQFLDISEHQLVSLKESGTVIGQLKPSAAAQLGLLTHVLVITGAMDQTAGMIGAGNINPGVITETTGGALAVCKTLNKYPFTTDHHFLIQNHALPDKMLLTSWCSSGGLSHKWIIDLLNPQLDANTDMKKQFKRYDSLAQKVSVGSQGLFFFPFLTGPGTLSVDPAARACFYGIELYHKQEHFIRAVLESIAYILREMIEEFENFDHAPIKEIRSMGGGAKSSLWNQIKSDITGKPIVTLQNTETASLGIAILSSLAMNQFTSIEESVAHLVKPQTYFYPNQDAQDKSHAAYLEFIRLKNKIFNN
jgi:xylulokinase